MLDMVLGTDMKHHFNLMGTLKSKLIMNSSRQSMLQAMPPKISSDPSPGDTFSRKSHDSSSHSLKFVSMSKVTSDVHHKSILSSGSVRSSFNKPPSRYPSGLLVLGDKPESSSLLAPSPGEGSTAGTNICSGPLQKSGKS